MGRRTNTKLLPFVFLPRFASLGGWRLLVDCFWPVASGAQLVRASQASRRRRHHHHHQMICASIVGANQLMATI